MTPIGMPPNLLAQRAATKREHSRDDLDMTPMVDVTFLLLIFCMVTAAFSLQKSIPMPPQQSDAATTNRVVDQTPTTTTEVQVDQFGAFLVLAQQWQEETVGKQNLIPLLKRANADLSSDQNEDNNESRLIVRVHEECRLQHLVDAMDAGITAQFAQTQVMQVRAF